MNPFWLVPQWPAPPSVRAVFTSRQGGVSAAPYDCLNLGDHVGDAAARVAANRAQLSRSIGARAVFLRQVHRAGVAELDVGTADGGQADACSTTRAALACTVMVADCLPVLLSRRDGARVAAAHAGWRGLAGVPALRTALPAERQAAGEPAFTDVLSAVLRSFTASAGVNTSCAATDLIAWLGPCIGPAAFEVGAEVRAAFMAQLAGADEWFQRTSAGKFRADLPGLARLRLRTLGMGDEQVYGNDSSPSWCTASDPSRFFSHRRDGAATGRMAACIWRV